MRPKINTQDEFEFQPSNLKLTNDYYAKYQAISAILDENQEIKDTIHSDLTSVLEKNVARDVTFQPSAIDGSGNGGSFPVLR